MRNLWRLSRAAHRPPHPPWWRFQPPHQNPHQPHSTLTSTTSPSPPQILLRPYQESCIAAILHALARGASRLGVSLATGGGKTIIFTHLIARVPPPSPRATRTLIVAHRRELIEQAARKCADTYPLLTVEVEMGSMRASGSADVTVASVQSIMSKDRLAKFDPGAFKLLVVDEAHHVVAARYLALLKHFGLEGRREGEGEDRGRREGPALVGASATFSRHDALSLGAAVDEIVYHKDYMEGIKEGWLSQASFTTVESTVDLRRVKTLGKEGDFKVGELSQAINVDKVNELTVGAWFARARERKSTLVFCVDVAHVKALTEAFLKVGIAARYITGTTAAVQRAEVLQDFKDGKFPVLLNCGIFTEGTDIPNIDCILLARPTKSRNLLIQMVGRGLRLFPGKKDVHIIDMVSALQTGIVTTPTLFGLDPAELVENQSVAAMEDRVEQRAQQKLREHEEAVANAATTPSDNTSPDPWTGNVTFTDYSTMQDFLEDASKEHFIRAISPYSWVHVSSAKFVLRNIRSDELQVHKEAPDRYLVTLLTKTPIGFDTKSPYLRPRTIASAETFEHAVRAADTYANRNWGHRELVHAAPWRNARATEKQVALLNKALVPKTPFTVLTLSRGKATDMIIKMKHGAKTQFSKLERARRKAEEKEDKRKSALLEAESHRIKVGAVK